MQHRLCCLVPGGPRVTHKKGGRSSSLSTVSYPACAACCTIHTACAAHSLVQRPHHAQRSAKLSRGQAAGVAVRQHAQLAPNAAPARLCSLQQRLRSKVSNGLRRATSASSAAATSSSAAAGCCSQHAKPAVLLPLGTGMLTGWRKVPAGCGQPRRPACKPAHHTCWQR
jgi:hypothetical protein